VGLPVLKPLLVNPGSTRKNSCFLKGGKSDLHSQGKTEKNLVRLI
jgi:hypothetical protein